MDAADRDQGAAQDRARQKPGAPHGDVQVVGGCREQVDRFLHVAPGGGDPDLESGGQPGVECRRCVDGPEPAGLGGQKSRHRHRDGRCVDVFTALHHLRVKAYSLRTMRDAVAEGRTSHLPFNPPKRIWATLRTALNQAIKQEQLITVNLAKFVELDSGRRPKAVMWTDEYAAAWKENRRERAVVALELDPARERRDHSLIARLEAQLDRLDDAERPSPVIVWTPE